jgi:hypothetical protein
VILPWAGTAGATVTSLPRLGPPQRHEFRGRLSPQQRVDLLQHVVLGPDPLGEPIRDLVGPLGAGLPRVGVDHGYRAACRGPGIRERLGQGPGERNDDLGAIA